MQRSRKIYDLQSEEKSIPKNRPQTNIQVRTSRNVKNNFKLFNCILHVQNLRERRKTIRKDMKIF